MYEKPIKTLGVYFGNNKEDCEKLNWENKIDKMNTLFFSWGKLANINQFLPNCLKYLYGINYQLSISPLTNLLTHE
jgi:hypothetical protein